jgi:RHS repeat-associated protein
VTRYLWDIAAPLPLLALERDGQGNTLRRYTYGAGLLSMTVSGQPHYFHHDAQGSVVNITSPSGATEWTYAYEPYGATRTSTQNDGSAPANTVGFTGELRDETGLYDMRARMYEPSTGRFLGLDPLAPNASDPAISAYAYANNQPTVLSDPSGMGPVRGGTGSDCIPPPDQYHGPEELRYAWEEGYRMVCTGSGSLHDGNPWGGLGLRDCEPPTELYRGPEILLPIWINSYITTCTSLRAKLQSDLSKVRCNILAQIGKWVIVVGGSVIAAGSGGLFVWGLITKGLFEVIHWAPIAAGGVGAGGLLTYGGLTKC